MTLKNHALFTILLAALSILMLSHCDSNETEDLQIQKRPIDAVSFADINENMPRYEPQFSDSILRKLETEELRLSLASHHLLQVGQYALVNEMNDLALDWGLDSLVEEEVKYLDNFRFADAYKEIVRQAKDHEVVIITESHTKPVHRVFTSQLLKQLYDAGYRALGLENIQAMWEVTNGALLDSVMEERGYPLLSSLSGIYTSESHYANLIRQATILGFDVFAYERNGSSESERDQQQAEHIAQYRADHPGAKIVCYGGWSHAIETPILKRGKEGDYWMAYELKLMTGIDPLTVYLDALNKKQSPEVRSSPYYDHLLAKYGEPPLPVVLKDESGNYYRGAHNQLPFDLVVLSPKDQYTAEGLPSWLQYYSWQFHDFAPWINEIPESSFPIIWTVREPHASDIATPIHCYELQAPVGTFELPVFMKAARIMAYNSSYELIYDQTVQLE